MHDLLHHLSVHTNKQVELLADQEPESEKIPTLGLYLTPKILALNRSQTASTSLPPPPYRFGTLYLFSNFFPPSARNPGSPQRR